MKISKKETNKGSNFGDNDSNTKCKPTMNLKNRQGKLNRSGNKDMHVSFQQANTNKVVSPANVNKHNKNFGVLQKQPFSKKRGPLSSNQTNQNFPQKTSLKQFSGAKFPFRTQGQSNSNTVNAKDINFGEDCDESIDEVDDDADEDDSQNDDGSVDEEDNDSVDEEDNDSVDEEDNDSVDEEDDNCGEEDGGDNDSADGHGVKKEPISGKMAQLQKIGATNKKGQKQMIKQEKIEVQERKNQGVLGIKQEKIEVQERKNQGVLGNCNSTLPEKIENRRSEIPEDLLKEEIERRNKRNARRLYVKGFPDDTTVPDLKALSPDILSVFLHDNSRYAFLEFENEQKAHENYEKIKGTKIKGVEFTLNIPEIKSHKELLAHKNIVVIPNRLFCDVPVEATVADIATLFPKAVSLTITDELHLRKAYVVFNNVDETAEAFRSNENAKIQNVPVTVRFVTETLSSRKRQHPGDNRHGEGRKKKRFRQ